MGSQCTQTCSWWSCWTLLDLDPVCFGTSRLSIWNLDQKGNRKSNYNLPMPKMTCTDISRIMQSDEVKAALRAPKKGSKRTTCKKNPLKNHRVMMRLNPAHAALKRARLLEQERRIAAKSA